MTKSKPRRIDGAHGWDRKLIDAEKESIKAELDAAGDSDSEKRLKHAFECVVRLGDDNSSIGRLRCYIYAMSALVHHRRHEGLYSNQIRTLSRIANGILQAEKINPDSSRLSGLYGDLHSILSQIYRKEGNHLLSIWEQEAASRLIPTDHQMGKGFRHLGMAIRVLRFGQSSLALRTFYRAFKEGLEEESLFRCQLGIARTLRLQKRFDEAITHCVAARSIPTLNPSQELDIQWELLSIEAQKSGRIDTLVRTISANSPHFSAAYILEGYFWIVAHSDRVWKDNHVLIRTLGRDKRLDLSKAGALFKCARGLEEVGDETLPADIRLEKIGELLEQRSQLESIDQELLLLAAIARTLYRARMTLPGSVVTGMYKSLSLTLSDGDSPDVLGILRDIVAKSSIDRTQRDVA